MKQFLSGLLFVAALVCGISNAAMAQVPSVVALPIPSTCAGFNTTLHYSATNSPNAYSISWFGSPAGLPNVSPGTILPPITIPITVLSTCAPGTYYGTLIISNTTGGSAPVSITVTVYGLPAIFNMTGSGGYCHGGAGIDIGLSGSETGVLYQVYQGGSMSGTSVWGTGSALDLGYRTLAGSYNVVATNAYTSCTSHMAGVSTVTVNPVPTAVNVTGGGGYCAGGAGVNVGLAASVFTTYYQLYRGSVSVSAPVSGIGMSLDFGPQTVPGTYTVLAIDSAGPCTAMMTGSAPVYIYPQPVVYHVTGGGRYCFGGYGVDVALTGSNTGIQYKLFNNGSILMGTLLGTGAGLDFGLQTPEGAYTVKAINPVYGCSEPMADTAHISYIPDSTPHVSIAATTTVCQGVVDTFRAVPVNGGSAPTYEWDLNGSFAAYGSTYIHAPNPSDNVKLIMTSNVTCAVPAVVEASLAVNVKPDLIPAVVLSTYPSSTIIRGTTEILSVALINGGVNPIYQWMVNGVIVAGANTATFSTNAFADGDSVSCVVYGCSDTPGHASVVLHVIPKAGVTQIAAGENGIQIVPNPNNGVFTLSCDMSADYAALSITDMLGKVVYRDNLNVSNGKVSSEVRLPPGIPAGMYMLNLRSDNQNVVSKIMLQ